MTVTGYFSVACIYLCASEGNTLEKINANLLGGGAKYIFWSAQSDLESVNSYVGSSNIWGVVRNCQFQMTTTVAGSACVYMDLASLTTDWEFHNNYFIVGNGYVGHFTSVVDAAGTRGPVTFRNNGAEVLSGSTSIGQFFFDISASYKTLNGLVIEDNRLVSASGKVPAILTGVKTILKGLRYSSGANTAVSATMSTDLEFEGLTNSQIITQGTVTIRDTTRNDNNVVIDGEAFNVYQTNGTEAFNILDSAGGKKGRLYADGAGVLTLDSENTFVNIIADSDGVPAGLVVRAVAALAIHPSIDNAITAGRAPYRYAEIFSVKATINTSDEREKTEILPISDAVLDAWADVEFIQYKWIESVEKKGAAARTHIGVIAQQIRDTFISHGLDATEYGMLCYDEWEDEYKEIDATYDVADGGELIELTPAESILVTPAGNRWGIRADQCQFLEMALMRRELNRLKQ